MLLVALMADVTRILNSIEGGDQRATEELLPLVYDELRLLASQKLSHERPGQTLQATALVHEAYIRLVGTDERGWDNRGHFFKAAAEAMRRILVDKARERKSLKRGGGQRRLDLNESIMVGEKEIHPHALLELDDSLNKLEARDRIAAELVKLRIFGGMAVKEAAQLLGISQSKAYTDLEYALAWLNLEMSDSNDASS